MTIGLILLNGGGCTSGGGWQSCGNFFSFSLLGDGGKRKEGVRSIPSYLLLLNRHHGRTATWSTCMGTSYNGRDPVITAPDLGSGDGSNGLGHP